MSRCTACQTPLPPAARFCSNCGAATGAPAPTAAPPAGERRLATILFADITGFTALSEQLDPEQVRGLMNACFDQLVPVVHKYGGTIDKFIGDEIMALFGVPVAHEDDPARALRAACEMSDALAAFNAANQTSLGMHTGVNTGLVVAGSIGSQGRQEYTVMGDAVNLAARLADTAPDGEIWLGPETRRYTAPLFRLEATGPVRVKGKSEPVQAYKFLGERARPGSVRGLAGMQSALVGRGAEQAALAAAVERLLAGQGGIALLIGEAGIGKSRLTAEWKKSLPPGILRAATGHSLSYGQNIAYHLLIDLLRALIGVSATAGEPETRAALQGMMTALWSRTPPERYPFLGHLLSLELDGEARTRVSHLDPQGLQSHYLDSLRALLVSLAAHRPLILILEDIHWADPSSVELLTRLLPLVGEIPALFCFVTRPEPQVPGWQLVETARANFAAQLVELNLPALTEADSRELIHNLLEIEALPEAARAGILQKAEGNPFFVEEIIRMLIERGLLVGEGGRWRAASRVDAVDIPDTLQGLLLSRIDRLPEAHKNALRVAAVLGRRFPAHLLEQVAGIPPDWASLEETGLIRPLNSPEPEYLFHHELVQNAVYQSILREDRARLHCKVGETLEAQYSERREEYAAQLAHHFSAAEDQPRALKYFTLAGNFAAQSYANQEAEDHYRRALQLAEPAETRAPLLASLGQVLTRQARYQQAIESWLKAISLYQALANYDQVGWLYARMVRAISYSGDLPGSLEMCREGLAAMQPQPDSVGKAAMFHEAARSFYFNGQADEAEPLCRAALALGEKLGNGEIIAESLSTLGILPGLSSEESLDVLGRACRIAEEHHLLATAARAFNNYANALEETGRLEEARAQFHRAADFCRIRGSASEELFVMSQVVDISLWLGDLAGAEALVPRLHALLRAAQTLAAGAYNLHTTEGLLQRYRGSLEEAERLFGEFRLDALRRGDLSNLLIQTFHLAEVLTETGKYGQAETVIQEALAHGAQNVGHQGPWLYALLAIAQVERGQPGRAGKALQAAQQLLAQNANPFGDCLAALAEALIALREGHPAEAWAGYARASEVVKRLGMRWYEAQAWVAWGRALLLQSAPAEIARGKELLRQAIARFDELGVGAYSERTRRLLELAGAVEG
jgi:class 3 adenylate cyclase/tetratricopeptide (TPR) repeat protein